jgi:hypothetical protein
MGRHRRRSRSLSRLRWSLAVVAVSAGSVALAGGAGPPAAGPAVVAAGSAGLPPAPVLAAPVATPEGVTAARVVIPAIGVDSLLAPLGVDSAGTLVPPSDFAQAGWFGAGTRPGEVGPAVLAGHVDSYAGPAVFFRLEDLTAGDAVQVLRSDGRTVSFRVTRVAQYPKDRFATTEVYGPTAAPELRLITCGGTFDRSRRSYEDNIVVYAREA